MKVHCVRWSLVVAVMVVGLGAGAADPPAERVLYHGPLEKQFIEIERDVPGFAGWHFDRDGNAIVRVKDASQQAAAIERVGRILDERARAGRGRAAARQGRPQITARPALYSFSELAAFRHAITRNLPAAVHQFDVNEVDNVLVLGVDKESDIGPVRAAAARAGIPGNALRVQVADRVRTRLTLADYQRPLHGGNGFTFFKPGYLAECTIGVNGYLTLPRSPEGFMTASHCTGTTWSNTSTIAYQATPYTQAGTEWRDPAPWSGAPCPANPQGSTCRYSDAAFYRYDSTGYGAGPSIARTDWTQPPPTTTVIGSMPVLNNYYVAPVGDWLDKIGRNSGWTWGQVLESCQATAHPDPNPNGGGVVFLLCQDITNIHVVGGDSGSPIFKWFDYDHVEWAGILWGVSSRGTWHSPVAGVESDFPAFTQW